MLYDYLSLDSLALQLALPKTYMKRLVDAGKIPYLTVSGRKRFQEKSVRQALERMATTSRQRTILG